MDRTAGLRTLIGAGVLALATSGALAAAAVPASAAGAHLDDLHYVASYDSEVRCETAGENGLAGGAWDNYQCYSDGGNTPGVWDLYVSP